MAKDFTVTVSGARGEEFESVFGTKTVPIVDFIGEMARLPGFAEAQHVYKLDLKLLTAEQRDRLVQHISRKFGLPEALIDKELDSSGVPILADDCVVVIANPQRWID